MNNKSGSEQVGENWEYFLDKSYFDTWCVRNKCEREFHQSLHLNNRDEAVGLFNLLEAKDAQLSHLQKLCEEQGNRLANLNLVLEGYKLLAGLSTTDHLKVQGMIESQLVTQTAEIERLEKERNDLEKLVGGLDVENPSAVDTLIDALNIQKENYQVTKDLLATQTERAKAQDAEIEKLRAFADHILEGYSWDHDVDGGDAQEKAIELGLVELRHIEPEDSIDGETEHYFTKWTPKQAINQERLGDGK